MYICIYVKMFIRKVGKLEVSWKNGNVETWSQPLEILIPFVTICLVGDEPKHTDRMSTRSMFHIKSIWFESWVSVQFAFAKMYKTVMIRCSDNRSNQGSQQNLLKTSAEAWWTCWDRRLWLLFQNLWCHVLEGTWSGMAWCGCGWILWLCQWIHTIDHWEKVLAGVRDCFNWAISQG